MAPCRRHWETRFSSFKRFLTHGHILRGGDSRVSSIMLTRLVKIYLGAGKATRSCSENNYRRIEMEARLVVQDHAEEAIVDRQLAVAFVIDKAELPELIQKMTDPRPGCADHL